MTAGGDHGFTVIGTEKVFAGRLLNVEVRRLEAPGGERFVREMVRHPGSVAALPHRDGEVVLLRIHRAPIATSLLEIPAGLRDVLDEDPEDTACRECEEEIGMRPGRVSLLTSFYNSPGYSDEYTHVYLAEDLVEVPARPAGAEEHDAEIVTMPVNEALAMVARGEIIDAKTIVALLALAARRDAGA